MKYYRVTEIRVAYIQAESSHEAVSLFNEIEPCSNFHDVSIEEEEEDILKEQGIECWRVEYVPYLIDMPGKYRKVYKGKIE